MGEEITEKIVVDIYNTKKVDAQIIADNLKQIHENPVTVAKDVESLRQLILKEEDLNALLDYDFLLRFLRARKFDQKRAVTLLKEYYKQRYKHKELFNNMKPTLMIHCFEDNFQVPLVNRDRLGRRVGFIRMANWNPDKFTVSELILSIVMGMEKAIEEEETQICGMCSIVDAKDFSLYQAKHITIAAIKMAINLIQKCFPVRLKAVHIVNVSPISRAIIATAKLFLGEKMRSRIHAYGSDFSRLHEQIDPSILPKELGGELEPTMFTVFYQRLLDSEEYFEKMLTYGYTRMPH